MGMFSLRKVDCRVFGFLVKSHGSLMKAAATSETAAMVVEQAVFLSRSSPSFLFVRFKKIVGLPSAVTRRRCQLFIASIICRY